MKLVEVKKQIEKDYTVVAFIFQTVYGIPLEIFNEWGKGISYLKAAKKCAYWRKNMPEYFEPL